MNTKINTGLALALCYAGMFVGCVEKKTERNRPNILFIMREDHGDQVIRTYVHGLNSTPNIDRIANEGAIYIKTTKQSNKKQ